MAEIDAITQGVLDKIDGVGFKQEGAYNLRYNGYPLCHGDSEHIKIKRKEDKPGIDVIISGDADGEYVHIPVVVNTSGMTDEDRKSTRLNSSHREKSRMPSSA